MWLSQLFNEPLGEMIHKKIYIKPNINLLCIDRSIMILMASTRKLPTSPSEGNTGGPNGPNSSGAKVKKIAPDSFVGKTPF